MALLLLAVPHKPVTRPTRKPLSTGAICTAECSGERTKPLIGKQTFTDKQRLGAVRAMTEIALFKLQ